MSAEVCWEDGKTVLARSGRFDLIFKYELARAWAGMEPVVVRRAEEAYLEMVRARNGFYEREPRRTTPVDFLESFRRVAESIRTHGYNPDSPPIPTDSEGEILNGAHRLAACAAYGLRCRTAVTDLGRAGGSVESGLRKGNIAPAVADWGIRAYLREFPSGRLAADFKARELGPVEPFPDWRVRATEFSSRHWGMRLSRMRYRVISLWRTGRKLEKARSHADELTCRMRSYDALAEYWEKQAK